MDKKMKPLLTIGIIFRNDSRCLERCLKALAPLREAVPCELIMADTGSEDGSREIAAHYAEVLFDFPWIDDFAAARNAVMDRASGRWYLTVDTDEYLDPDISELLAFLRNADKIGADVCSVVQRSYSTLEMDDEYVDFEAMRLVRMSTGVRYQGAIHEALALSTKEWRIHILPRTILHHDGYVGLNDERGKAKRDRNLRLLRAELEKDPENLRALLQYIESGRTEEDFVEVVRRAVELVKKKVRDWDSMGSAILRHGVRTAKEKNLPELFEWIAYAEECFPDSYHTRIDIEFIAFSESLLKGDYEDGIRRGERYLQALKDYHEGRGDQFTTLYSGLLLASVYKELVLKLFLADTYLRAGKSEKAGRLLGTLDYTLMSGDQAGQMTSLLRRVHAQSQMDTSSLLLRFYEGIHQEVPNKDRAGKRSRAFHQIAVRAFLPEVQKTEEQEKNFQRYSYTLFLPLEEKCDEGRAAAILETQNPAKIRRLLLEVESWEQMPIEALTHALENGIAFPLPDKPLRLEEIDGLIGRLAQNKESFYRLFWRAAKEELPEDFQRLAWVRGLAMAAVGMFEWGDAGKISGGFWQPEDMGLSVAQFFVQVEEAFLPLCYMPYMLSESGAMLLPSLHRFGWYCIQAFAALEAGELTQYVRLLHKGLAVCQDRKAMVGYLMEHTPQLQSAAASKELSALAEQVRTILAAYSPEDPAVKALKASPAYQKVAWMIERNESLQM